MSGFVTLLIIVGVLVVLLEYTNRHRSPFAGPLGTDPRHDRDRDRLIADLGAHRD